MSDDREKVTPVAYGRVDAATYLGFDDPRWLDNAPIPRVDLRKPGAAKPTWRWRKVDLDAFLESRLVPPGMASPFV